MTRVFILIAMVALFGCAVFANTLDPVADYKNAKSLATTDILYKWAIDINGDGQSEVFLGLKEAYQEDKEDGQVPSWHVYVALASGGGYYKPIGIDDGNPKGIGYGLPKIDTDRMFVGEITQLNKYGLASYQKDITRSGSSVARIYAYTIEGNVLKETTLAEYDADQPNAIFDQYLKDNVRTQVQLQEVTP